MREYYLQLSLSQWGLIALLVLLWVLFVLAYCQRSQKSRVIKRFLLKHFNKMALPVGIMGAAFYLRLLIWMPERLYFLYLPSSQHIRAEHLSNDAFFMLLLALLTWLLSGVIYCSWQMFKHRKQRSGARLLRILLAGTLTFLPMLVCFIGYITKLNGGDMWAALDLCHWHNWR